MKKKSFSMKYRVMLWVGLLLLPLVLLLGSFAVVQIEAVYRQLETSERTNLNLLVSRLEEEVEDVETYLYDMVLENRTFRSMADIRTDVQLYGSTYEVFEASDNLFNTQQDLSFLLLYSVANEFYAAHGTELKDLTLSEQIYLQDAMERRSLRLFGEAQGPSQNREWFPLQIAERWFLCRTIRYEGMYCAGLFDLKSLAERLTAELTEGGILVFCAEGKPLTAIPDNISMDNLSRQTFRDTEGRQYMVLSETLHDMELYYLFPYNSIWGMMGLSLLVVLVISVIVLAALPVFYLRLQRDFFHPLDNLVETMQRIRDGNASAVDEAALTCEEFLEVNHTFHQMLDQIQNLKIQRYERELEKQRTELFFLQEQIRPHFYLNCLKTMYSLAEQHQYVDIENCILLVSKHLRYAFQKHTDIVPLREELDLCDNYVKLYGLMTDITPLLTLDIESVLFDTPVPPISLLTFVENSIRINLPFQRGLCIHIKVNKMQTEEGMFLCLTVQDNGTGFEQKQLERLNSTNWLDDNANHVGLQNVVRRFSIVYGDSFSIAFFNHKGAVLELYLPIDISPIKEANTDEAADRR